MVCEKCGNEIAADSKFCQKCGVTQSAKYCQRCGSALCEGDAFCGVCGQGVGQPVLSPINKKASYEKLGGWLAFIAYGSLVLGILSLLSAITSYVGGILFFDIWSLVGYTYLYTLICLILSILLFLLFYCIKKKKQNFLNFFDMYLICRGCIVLGLIVVILKDFAKRNGNFGVVSLLIFPLYILPFVLCEIYFIKSKRVKEYFGGDEYLRRSILFKRLAKNNVKHK